MDQPEAPGREAAAVQNKPETLEQCHAVIEQMGQELAQLREQVRIQPPGIDNIVKPVKSG